MIETAENHSSSPLEAKRALALLARADHQTLQQVWEKLALKQRFAKFAARKSGSLWSRVASVAVATRSIWARPLFAAHPS